ncbi:COX15/CtaA family protein [Polymorphum gilvum]|uniref:Heme A synthase n=1 Tax=Polymorphum gilvum (strain LMG 25793 / CGMCC 1.9160 / SL003B-26A1) TaxID=991905 RepID=F2IWP1_POLGS|nr:COX15/CtaA family protein [Polymorphum gilvum]ADZ70366.1 Putative cytochrome c oxidase assembly transmembrane protein [Polymorphum gilvum SL003B-26A1]
MPIPSTAVPPAAVTVPPADRALARNRALIRWWLYGICLLILAMVVVGGATRLTESGLSITEWKPIHGMIPPLNEAEWQEEFDKYRQIPQYQLINKGMSMDEFKFIFWWEWAHRQLGRFIGIAYFVPLALFWLQGRVEPWLKPRLVLGLFLGGLQGAVGWWMVASGLVERTDVSQYRLAVHLTLACVIFAYLFWLARRLVPARRTAPDADRASTPFAKAVLALVLVQIFLGGLVAGLNAGLTFNTWPLMDGQIVPAGLLAMEPAWKNFFENVMTVQFQHRVAAYVLVAAVLVFAWSVLTRSAHAPLRGAAMALGGLVLAQLVLGILTLLAQVPLDLALLHQATAVLVLGAAVEVLVVLKGPVPGGAAAAG